MAKNKRGERVSERENSSRNGNYLCREIGRKEREIEGVRGKRIGRGNLPLFLPHVCMCEEEKESGKRRGGRTPCDRKISVAREGRRVERSSLRNSRCDRERGRERRARKIEKEREVTGEKKREGERGRG